MKTSEDVARSKNSIEEASRLVDDLPAARASTRSATSCSAGRCATTSGDSRASRSGCSGDRRAEGRGQEAARGARPVREAAKPSRSPSASRPSRRSASRPPPKGCASCANATALEKRRAARRSAVRVQRELRQQILDHHRSISDELRQKVDDVLAPLAREPRPPHGQDRPRHAGLAPDRDGDAADQRAADSRHRGWRETADARGTGALMPHSTTGGSHEPTPRTCRRCARCCRSRAAQLSRER